MSMMGGKNESNLFCRPEAKPSSCGPARAELRAPVARSGTHLDATGMGAVRVRRPYGLRVFPGHQHRLDALCHGKRCIGGNRGHRKRGFGRHLLVYGRRKYAEPSGGAKRRQRLPAQGEYSETGIRAGRSIATLGAAFHAGADCPDVANRGMQPTPYTGPTAMPLAIVEPGPLAKQ